MKNGCRAGILCNPCITHSTMGARLAIPLFRSASLSTPSTGSPASVANATSMSPPGLARPSSKPSSATSLRTLCLAVPLSPTSPPKRQGIPLLPLTAAGGRQGSPAAAGARPATAPPGCPPNWSACPSRCNRAKDRLGSPLCLRSFSATTTAYSSAIPAARHVTPSLYQAIEKNLGGRRQILWPA